MKRMAVLACLVLALVRTGDVAAEESAASAFEGAYLLIQDDNFQRILSLDRAGTISQVSDQEPLLGFTAGLGAWRRTGPESVRARVVDFSYEGNGGEPIGSALIIYDLTFSDLAAGKYQKVSGIYAGEQFAPGQNPLNPNEPPIRIFSVAFKGQRITAETEHCAAAGCGKPPSPIAELPAVWRNPSRRTGSPIRDSRLENDHATVSASWTAPFRPRRQHENDGLGSLSGCLLSYCSPRLPARSSAGRGLRATGSDETRGQTSAEEEHGMSFSESHEMEGTLKECLRELVSALADRDFEVTGDEVIVRDGDKRFVISLMYEGDRRLGSLDLPMTRVDYTCSGCTEAEAKAFHEHIAKHIMREGGG